MPKSTPLEVLNELKRFLNIAQLCKRGPVRFHTLEVPLTVVQFVMFLPFVTFPISVIWYDFEKHFELAAIASAMNLFLGSLQIYLVYISLALNNSTIIETIDGFQRVVDDSEHIFINFVLIWSILISAILHLSKNTHL